MAQTPTAPLPADPTLDEIRAALAPLIAENAAFDGFGDAALADAAARLGVDADVARLAFPGGARDMVDAWFASIDAAMADRWPAEKLATLKVRERITTLVETRIDLLAPDRESLRRALALLALPTNAPHAARLGWRAADLMWNLAGDTATDFNHYSKRTILGAVYGSTMAVFLNDESEDFAETRAFLARRIDQVMRFESWKHRRTARSSERPSLARFIGRLRYPGR
ncbi:RpsU-divergently transcribed [Sphingopyxis sp. H050]|jgi:ubiquinone biosynthesis protein COQ9|uniref:COQ9 family protein n=1 Tax=Sphingopyxis sp. H050 TaxID=1759072 RepID=UPI0007377789|nr:COQ9 family protein [Sphingopyxis sp. H050]KTE18638.1 RpsU-divergently transcribed [Sphingopyxis sp. H050]